MNEGFAHCLTCAGDRELIKYDGFNFGPCDCTNGKSDIYESFCAQNPYGVSFEYINIVMMTITMGVTAVATVLTLNPLLMVSLVNAA